MERLGQHFLKNISVLTTIIDKLEVESGDTIIEIGAGHGELTIPLSLLCEKLNCSIVALEKDRMLANGLVEKIKSLGRKNCDVVEGDALAILDKEVSKLTTGTYKIVGNVPYYITGKLLRTIGELEKKPERSILMIQHEVAERICTLPPKMNRLAASVQFWGDPEIVAFVPRKDFSPPPKIDSSVILISTKKDLPEVSPEKYYRALRALFAQPRKTILNNLSTAREGNSSKESIVLDLKRLSIDPESRPQNLAVKDIFEIAKKIF